MRFLRLGWLACLWLVGCAHLPESQVPPKPMSSVRLESTITEYQALKGSGAWPNAQWWKAFGDSSLNKMEAEALSGNPTLEETAARIRLADAKVSQMSAATGLNLSLDGSVNRQRLSENGLIPPPFSGSTVNFGNLAIDYSQDFDFWGLNKAKVAAARANLNAAIASEDEARMLIAVSVARTWFNLGRIDQDLRLQYSYLKINRTQLALDEALEKAGLESSLPVIDDKAKQEALLSYLHVLEAQNEAGRYQLAALVGRSPDAANMFSKASLPKNIAYGVPPTLPFDLLSRRADIVELRDLIEASHSNVKAAQAAFFPNVNLSAMLGFQSINLGSLVKSGNLATSFGPAFNLPIFEGGALRANLSASEASYEENVAQYNQAVLNAAKQVAQALSGLKSELSQLEHAKLALVDANDALNLAKYRYESGITDLSAELRAKENRILAMRTVNSLEVGNFLAQLDLIKALGGGYQMPSAQTARKE